MSANSICGTLSCRILFIYVSISVGFKIGYSRMRDRHKVAHLSLLVAALSATFLAKSVSGSDSAIRGLAPELKSRYAFQNDVFACFSGGSPFPAVRVNDDFCDCLDGSDEPGLLTALYCQFLPRSCSAKLALECLQANLFRFFALSFQV